MGITLLDAEFIIREHKFKPLPRTVYCLGRQSVLFDCRSAQELLWRHGVAPADVPVALERGTSYAIHAGRDPI
jgi:hypothetical protein